MFRRKRKVQKEDRSEGKETEEGRSSAIRVNTAERSQVNYIKSELRLDEEEEEEGERR